MVGGCLREGGSGGGVNQDWGREEIVRMRVEDVL